MEKIIVTGAGGFIGSHLTENLVEKGYHVKAFLKYNSRNRWGWIEGSKYLDDIEIVTGDIRDFDVVSRAMKNCETVFHLAALIGIPYSYVSPLAYIKTNIEGTYNVLQSAKKYDLKNVLITSTSETYGTAKYVPIDEKHLLEGQSPYSATKIAADHLALSFYRSFDLPVKIVRPFNTYGPRQSARAIIPTIIAQILSAKEVISLGNLQPTRDLTFVRDTVSGFMHIYKSMALFGEVTNIGMNKEISIGDLSRLIGELMGENIVIEDEKRRVRPKNSEVERLLCDNSKLKKNTGWEPKYDLKKGLLETIEWMRGHSHLYKASLYNV